MIYKFMYHSVMAEKFDNMRVHIKIYWSGPVSQDKVQQQKPKFDLWSKTVMTLRMLNVLPEWDTV